MKNDVSAKIKECLFDVKNKKTIDEIMIKMGRVLEKKHQLQNESPVLVFENRIWVGNYSFASNKEFLEMNQIKYVISCLQLPLSAYHQDITYERIQLKDCADDRFEENIFRFIDFVQRHQGGIFVHCFSGRSRSVALLLAFIMHRQRKTLDEALQLVRSVYPIANPNPYFCQKLRKMENSLSQRDIYSTQPQNNNLLDGDYHQIVQSPKKVQIQTVNRVKSEKQINLIDIGEDKQQKLSINLLDQTHSIQLGEKNSNKKQIPQETSQINIFQAQIPQVKQQSINNVQLLDFTHQSNQGSSQDTVYTFVQRSIDRIESFQPDNLIQLQETSKQNQKEAIKIQQVNVQDTKLLDESTKQAQKVEKQDTFADNTDFTQKKVKKGKKHKR